MKKTQLLLNKPVYLGLIMLELSKIVTHEVWYDYIKTKYGENMKLLCYMYTDSFIVYVKTGDIYTNIAKNVESKFDASKYELGQKIMK